MSRVQAVAYWTFEVVGTAGLALLGALGLVCLVDWSMDRRRPNDPTQAKIRSVT